MFPCLTQVSLHRAECSINSIHDGRDGPGPPFFPHARPGSDLMAYHSMHVSAKALSVWRETPRNMVHTRTPTGCPSSACVVLLWGLWTFRLFVLPPVRHVMVHFYMDSPHRFRRGNISGWETSQTCAFEASTIVLALDCSGGDFKCVVGQVRKGKAKGKKENVSNTPPHRLPASHIKAT